MHNSRVVVVRFLIGLIRCGILTIVGSVTAIGFHSKEKLGIALLEVSARLSRPFPLHFRTFLFFWRITGGTAVGFAVNPIFADLPPRPGGKALKTLWIPVLAFLIFKISKPTVYKELSYHSAIFLDLYYTAELGKKYFERLFWFY
jgi:hypothetical protein